LLSFDVFKTAPRASPHDSHSVLQAAWKLELEFFVASV
jgi:hypothetical protein